MNISLYMLCRVINNNQCFRIDRQAKHSVLHQLRSIIDKISSILSQFLQHRVY